MANAEHVAILKKGVAAWNAWREAINPRLQPVSLGERLLDLRHADLREVDLKGAELRYVLMTGADLRGVQLDAASLGGADLADADLTGASLRGANLDSEISLFGGDPYETTLTRACLDAADLRDASFQEADLTEATLRGVNADRTNFHAARLSCANLVGGQFRSARLVQADLGGADLARANLIRADLWSAELLSANLARTLLARTLFVDVDLSEVRGLLDCDHQGPSVLDLRTLERSRHLPTVFLQGCGVSEAWFAMLPTLSGRVIEFFSCFISYSHADRTFAHRLHDALQARGIRCWLDHHDLLPGDNVYRAINEAIRLWDKVLLCCSESSLKSWWVKDEVTRALEKEQRLEQERGTEVLAIIPLDLDDYLFENECELEFGPTLRKRHAAKFAGWQNDRAIFDAQLERVVRALRADDGARAEAPAPKL